jgi:NADPH:quinone reductase-like Zn-dependent oxidoreductase
MKAAVYCRYGPPDVVQIKEVERPVPNDNEVLIDVRAASVNPYDWHFMRGTPYFVRIFAGLRKPRTHDWALMWLARLRRWAGT